MIIDPDYPITRIDYMIESTKARVVCIHEYNKTHNLKNN